MVARRAVISNMTIWDTYGKLIGLNRTPAEIKKQLAQLRGGGAYLIYASLEEAAVARLPGSHFLVASSWSKSEVDEGSSYEFTFCYFSKQRTSRQTGGHY